MPGIEDLVVPVPEIKTEAEPEEAVANDYFAVPIKPSEKYTTPDSKVADSSVPAEPLENPEKSDDTPAWVKILISDAVGIKVKHSKFGVGTITWQNAEKQKIKVKFEVGEKLFVVAQAFSEGFLKLEE